MWGENECKCRACTIKKTDQECSQPNKPVNLPLNLSEILFRSDIAQRFLMWNNMWDKFPDQNEKNLGKIVLKTNIRDVWECRLWFWTHCPCFVSTSSLFCFFFLLFDWQASTDTNRCWRSLLWLLLRFRTHWQYTMTCKAKEKKKIQNTSKSCCRFTVWQDSRAG